VLQGCVGRLLLLVLLLGVAYAGWRWGEAVFPRVESVLRSESGEEETPPTPAMAEAVLARVEALLAGGGGEEENIALDGPSVSAVVRYGGLGLLPPGMEEAAVRFRDGSVILSVRAALASFPAFPELGGIMEILPDTVPLQLRAFVVAFGEGETALRVDAIDASGIPLPRRTFPAILEALGRQERPGLPPEAVPLPLPRGLRTIYIRGDSLHLVREP